MVDMKVTVLACCLVLCSASWPTTYPFENEQVVPVEVPAGTPSWTYEPGSDTGGYMYYGAYTMSVYENGILTDDDMPYCTHMNRGTEYVLVVAYGAPPQLPLSVWNCSSMVFTDADFTGLLSGAPVCNVGSCCVELIGKPKFSDDQMDYHTAMNDRLASAMCGDLPEQTYCIFVGGHFENNCIDYVLSAVERLVTFPCFDDWIVYHLSCPVYKQAYTMFLADTEPDSYFNTLSIEEVQVIDVICFLGDHVCHPHSYYNPSAAVTSASSASTTDSAASNESDESSAAVITLFLCVFFLA